MALEDKKSLTPPASFYDRPYLPSAAECDGYETVPLLAVEAHTILVDSAGRPMSTIDRLTLERISEADSDETVDFLAARRRVMVEFGIDDDWD